MRRRLEADLVSWKQRTRRKPLVVRGARQVGKTTTITAFGEREFDELAVVDLERDRRWHRVFEPDLDAARILAELRIVLDRDIVPGRSLLFLDEIQACPRAVTALRYLHEEVPGLHVIAAGSLLEFALSEVSFPVGRLQFLEMAPVTFAEFLEATGLERAAAVVLDPDEPVADAVHQMLLDELRKFLFVGGMPECVDVFARTGSIRACREVQRELCESFRHDFARYTPRTDPDCLDAVLSGAARHAGEQIKYTRLAEGWSIPTVKKALGLLHTARVVRRVPAASAAGVPLAATASARKFKALLLDVGLLQQLRALPMEVEYTRRDLLAIHEGALAEQFVGQELLAALDGDLYYWSRAARSSTAEVDYLFSTGGTPRPVEVKSGPAGRLKSLHQLLGEHPDCGDGLVLSTAPPAHLPEQRLRFAPLYHAYALARPP